ncbi:MAG: M13 family metallopeptidase [Prevotella sp.]|nr:M13 family metallopeptidase [Bacteroides sp.]MCM1366735.1 M13 family metallopeptidase [Prevotella sp.]MCM1437027.1 M13 family metallopeptidase [Prevotella sp.]
MNNLRLAALAATALLFMGANAQEHLKSYDKANTSATVSAKTDFYQHANEGWMKSHPLTPEYARYGQFNILNDSSNNRVERIMTNLKASNPAKGTNAQKVADLYELGNDMKRRNKLGAKPILPVLAKIETANPDEMDDLFLYMHREISSPFFTAVPQEDLDNSSIFAMYLGGGGMGLSDRDYYLKDDQRNKEVREAYKKLIQKQMQLAGYNKKDAARIVNSVMKIETALADSAWTREQSRNLLAMNNRRSMEQIKAAYPNVPWDKFFIETMKIETPDSVIVTELSCMNQANNLLASTTDREKKDYYLWKAVNQAAPYLSEAFDNANFEFNKVVSGVQKQQPRWKKSLGTTESILGEAIGELYVEKYFPESSKKYMEGLVENVRRALGKHIINLPWMTDDTKLNAIKKLNAITVKIGYPDKWKDYTTLTIDPELSYYENVHNAHMWLQDDYLSRYGKPVDRTLWQMLPQQINAYYNPLNNEIVFPAGILQAPFYDPEASDAENYGGIGVVIGHELSHGFDDQGCNFDADGNMTNWWTAEDAKAFKELTQGLVAQFDEVEVLPGLHANGAYTLGENIGDQGGLRVAFTAFLDSQKKKGVDVESQEALIDGLTPAQAFYLNYANLWAQNVRDEEIRSLTVGDVHSIGKNRVNVTLKNLDPFFKAFGITEGDPMFRPENERIVIW